MRTYSLSQTTEQKPIDAVTIVQYACSDTVGDALAVNVSRRFLWITNIGSGDAYIKFGTTDATTSNSQILKANGGTVFFDTSVPTQKVTAICSAGVTTTLSVAHA